jgi:hypothetical protein
LTLMRATNPLLILLGHWKRTDLSLQIGMIIV